ncbi:hypothetical protein SNL152K_9401 [Streptomyces sp. NL15-2K]|nr:hypothetical protein SNL152K_9401 [Streptomyces sp. NL15-2K]
MALAGIRGIVVGGGCAGLGGQNGHGMRAVTYDRSRPGTT